MNPAAGEQAWLTALQLSRAAGTHYLEAVALLELGKLRNHPEKASEGRNLVQELIGSGNMQMPR